MYVFINNAHIFVIQYTTFLTTLTELSCKHIICATLIFAYFFDKYCIIPLRSEIQPEKNILQISYKPEMQLFWNATVLTMYKVTGRKGWNGQQIWIPNIKLPSDKVYYSVR